MHEHMETVQVVTTNHRMDILLLLDQRMHWLNWGLIFISHFLPLYVTAEATANPVECHRACHLAPWRGESEAK